MNNKYKNSHSISETTRKVFFISNTYIKPPSSLFVPALITVKGLYPPSIILLKTLLDTNNSIPNNIMIPRKSCSVPIKLITMQEHITSSISTTTTTTTTATTTTITTDIPLKKSQSTPPSPTTPNHNEPQIPKLISFEKSQINTAKSSRTPMKKWVLKKKKPITTKLQSAYLKEQGQEQEQEEEEDEPMTKPMSLTEKRKRQAKRADQVKIWKVREEREAREARLVLRRQMVNGNKKISQSTSTSSTTNTIRKKKKRVKFNFDKNSVIQLPSFNDSLEDI